MLHMSDAASRISIYFAMTFGVSARIIHAAAQTSRSAMSIGASPVIKAVQYIASRRSGREFARPHLRVSYR